MFFSGFFPQAEIFADPIVQLVRSLADRTEINEKGQAREEAAGDLLQLLDKHTAHRPRQRGEALARVVCDDHLGAQSSKFQNENAQY